MSASERKEAEDQLTAILNRALKHVPLVKLDAVDDVIKLFSEAIDLMESNQIMDDEPASNAAQSQHQVNDSRQSALLALAGSASTATTATNSNASSATSSGDESNDFRGLPVNKAVSGLASAALTVDYSSPSSKTRSLGGKPAPKAEAPRPAGATGLGLGLGNKSSSGQSAKPGVLGLHGGHKPSSRATTAVNAISSSPSGGSASPVSPTTPDSSSENDSENGNGPTGVLKNKLVAKLATPTSREYPSPKLGPRSLTAGGAAAAANANAKTTLPAAPGGLSLPMPDSLGRDAHQSNVPAGAASPDADDESVDEEPDETEAGDLIVTDKKNNVFNRVKETLPVTASPKQIRSSFHLLELATTQSIQPEDDDLTRKAPSTDATSNGAPSERPVGAGTGVLSSLPHSLQSSSTNTTPKPSYLRRLDSPDTHHGQLLQAKARLQLLLNKGIQLADRVNLAAVPEIKAKLERALAKLESSLVQATIGQ